MNIGLVVSDTGPILHLSEAGALGLLSKVALTSVPPAVERELNYLLPNWSKNRPVWLKVVELENPFLIHAIQWTTSGLLDKGEADALALALQLKANWLLTDDTSARVLGKSLQVEVHGSLGVVLWSAANGLLDRHESTTKLDALFRSSLWISRAVQAEARDALETIHAAS